MKVILVNGSPHKNGCTHTALEEVAGELNKAGIETEMFWCGVKPVMGCIGCGKCGTTKRCWYDGDTVNDFLGKAADADGFVFGTPIHFAEHREPSNRSWTVLSAQRRASTPTSPPQP